MTWSIPQPVEIIFAGFSGFRHSYLIYSYHENYYSPYQKVPSPPNDNIIVLEDTSTLTK